MASKRILLVVLGLFCFALLFSARVSALVATTPGVVVENQINLVRSRAEQEIDRRVESINSLIAKIQAMKKITDSEKSGFLAEANKLIADLGALKTKITTDSTLVELKTDRRSIFSSYRVYMLFMPKMHIMAAADRIFVIVGEVNAVLPGVQTGIDDAKANGKNVVLLQSAMDDLKIKLADAGLAAQKAIDIVNGLVADSGDPAKVQTNQTALKTAQGDIKQAISDLKSVRNDLKIIREGLK